MTAKTRPPNASADRTANEAMEVVEIAVQRVLGWVERNEYKGYEPFDGLSSSLRPLALGNQFAERLVMQAVRQSPVNLRPLVGIRPQESTKGRGYMAAGYVSLFKRTQKTEFRDKAILCLKWLDKHKCNCFTTHSWSNHFDFVSRAGGYTKNDPIIVWTALIGHAFLDAYDAFGEEWLLRVADSAAQWVYELPREKTQRGDCISYLAHVQSSIHNANMLGASLLARTAQRTGSRQFVEASRSAMEYSCSRQLANGSWWYAEAQKYHWVDNFHTGYNLDSLDTYISATGDETYRSNLDKGLEYYKKTFVEPSGRPRYYEQRAYPIDIQCAAQSIDTFARFADRDAEAGRLAETVALWTVRHMQDRRGHFHYRQYPWMTARTPMLHWGQATMFKALADLARVLAASRLPDAPKV